MQALHDVVKAGYVRYIGMSSCYAWQCKCFVHTCLPHTYISRLVHAMQSICLKIFQIL
jgi:aryl-alcohol dehydrogenase-like predicted oxidoreductase